MFGKVNHNLEAALMADGVAPGEVNAILQSPGGRDRAFEKLAEIAPHISVWYRGGSQAAQLLRDGEVDLIHIGNGRAESIIADGAPVAYTWNQATLDADCVLVPKGAPNRELAMKVINEMVSAESQARMAAAISYGPVNVTAFETGIVPAEQAAKNNSAPENLATQVILRSELLRRERSNSAGAVRHSGSAISLGVIVAMAEPGLLTTPSGRCTVWDSDHAGSTNVVLVHGFTCGPEDWTRRR